MRVSLVEALIILSIAILFATAATLAMLPLPRA